MRVKQDDKPVTRQVLRAEFANFARMLNKKFETIDGRFDAIDKRFEVIDRKFEAIDQKLEAIDKRFEKIERRIDAIERRIDAIEKRLGLIEKRLDIMDTKFEIIIKMISARFEAFTERILQKIDEKYQVWVITLESFAKRSEDNAQEILMWGTQHDRLEKRVTKVEKHLGFSTN